MSTSPTQRTIRELRNQGRLCDIVERFIAKAGPFGIRKDLFGIIDVVALDPERGVVGVQSCGQAFAEHYRTITQDRAEETIGWLTTPHTSLEIWSWSKKVVKRGGKAMRWQPRIKVITLADLGADGSEWRPVLGYEGIYEVSSKGIVRSLEREGTRIVKGKEQIHRVSPRVLSPSADTHGYLQVNLKREGGSKMIFVHRLVALAFIDNPESKPQINHIDGDANNNCVENLEWCTNSENALHATRVLGKVRGFVKLTVDDVRSIREMALSGMQQKEIAEQFDIADTTVSSIITRKRWPNV